MPYCMKCGAKVDANMGYCPNCAARLDFDPAIFAQENTPGYSSLGFAGKSTGISIRGHMEWTTWAFIVLIVMTFVTTWSYFLQAELLTAAINGQRITMAEAVANDDRVLQLGIIWTVIWIAATVIFLVWIHRAHKNLYKLGAENLQFSPGWAVGWFFIPIMNLFRPCQVMSEIWKAGKPEVNARDSLLWQSQPTSPIVWFWWALFLIDNLFGTVLWRIDIDTYEITELLTMTNLYIASDFVSIVGMVITIIMVRMVSNRQLSQRKDNEVSGWFEIQDA